MLPLVPPPLFVCPLPFAFVLLVFVLYLFFFVSHVIISCCTFNVTTAQVDHVYVYAFYTHGSEMLNDNLRFYPLAPQNQITTFDWSW